MIAAFVPGRVLVLATIVGVALVVMHGLDSIEPTIVRVDEQRVLDPSDEAPTASMRVEITTMTDEQRRLARQEAIENARHGCLHGHVPITGALLDLTRE